MPEMTMLQAINEAMRLEMRRDPKIFLAGEDIGIYGGAFGACRGLLNEFTERRVRDTPISESALIGLGVGAALVGLRPIIDLMYVDFIGVCFDQLYNEAAKTRYMFGGRLNVPMVVRAACGAGTGSGAQHSQCLEAWFMHVPGLKVVMPSTPFNAKGLLIAAIRDDDPVVFLEHKALYRIKGQVPEGNYTIPLGRADIKREGKDLTVVATARMVHLVLNVAEKLSAEGINIEVIDPQTILPLDEETILQSVKKTHRLAIVHEEVKFAGCGAEIAAIVAERAFDYLDSPILRIAAPFTPIPVARPLEAKFIPNEETIMEGLQSLVR